MNEKILKEFSNNMVKNQIKTGTVQYEKEKLSGYKNKLSFKPVNFIVRKKRMLLRNKIIKRKLSFFLKIHVNT